MKLNVVKAIVKKGIGSLLQSLNNYWPAINENDMSERNITWSPDIRNWWMEGNHRRAPLDARGAGWKTLGRRLDTYQATVGSIRLPGYGETEGKYNDLWSLYAIFRLH